MNVSYNWLKEYIDFDLTPSQLADTLTSIGLETGSVEEVESIKGGLKGLVIGKVLTCEEHPNSDHLHITTVDLGDGQATQIVCGAPNVAAGQTVVVATVGTTLYAPDGSSFQIKKSKIRGAESFGMICAEDEIGVGTSHDGIIVIEREVTPGTPAADYFGLTSDWQLEVDLTPNRIDAASHYGVARDLCAWMKTHRGKGALHLPEVAETLKADRPDGAIAVEVADTEGCLRYCGLTIRGVKVGESPEWLRSRLTTVGLRPINNIVDITNYILLGLGQPMHCFDLAKIEGERVVVRTCADGEPFTTLDGVERKLNAADVMICDAVKPMCIAGVFGGLDSGVTEGTTDIFLESACFHPTRVRRTARRHGLQTDASFRFERGVDPNLALYAMKVAAALIKELAGGEICGDIADIYPQPVAPYPVHLSYSYVNSLIGKEIDRATVDAILNALEIDVKPADADSADLLVPTYRVDVRRPCDVVEDLLRIYGYNNVEIGDTLQSSLSYETATDRRCRLNNTLANELTALGFNEIMNNSLSSEAYYADNEVYPADRCVRLLNPLSSELSVMRQTLLYGGLESVAHNLNRRENDLRFYEFGNVYSYDSKGADSECATAAYSEEPHLAIWLTGDWREAGWQHAAMPATVYDLKAVVENLMSRSGLTAELRFTPAEADATFSARALIDIKGTTAGSFGILRRDLLKRFDIKQELFYAEINTALLAKFALRSKVTFATPAKTHPVKRDLALLLDEGVKFEQVAETMRRAERKLLGNIKLFDVYEDPAHLPAGKKSYAITFTLQDQEKTLNDKQIDAIMNKIIGALRHQLGAELR